MIKINSKKYEAKDVLKININGDVYTLPLVKCLPYKKIKQLSALSENKNFDIAIEAMSEYIPREVLEDLTIDNLSTIFKAWNGKDEDGDGDEEELGK